MCTVCEGPEFCWVCSRAWVENSPYGGCGNKGCDSAKGLDKLIKILTDAPTDTIDDIDECPKVRACPKCAMLVEHAERCKHMTCGRNGNSGAWVSGAGCKH